MEVKLKDHTIAVLPFVNMSASKAHELNNHSSGVHYQLSNQAFFIECDYGKSLREMKEAIEIIIKPSCPG